MLAALQQHLPSPPPDSTPELSPSMSPEPEEGPSAPLAARRTPSFHLVLPLPRPASSPLLSSSPSAAILSSFYPPSSAEAQAHFHIHEHIHHDPQIGAKQMGLSSAYAAVQRYLAGEDLYILPRDGKELCDVLGRFARDVIHSLISQAKTRIEEGGYTRARSIATKSLKDKVLTPSGISNLLAVHKAREDEGLPHLTPSMSRESSGGSVSGDSEGEEVRTPGPGPGPMSGREKMRMTRMREGGGKDAANAGLVIADV